MIVYFYHTQDITRMRAEWQAGRFPGHLLYGATHLHKHGIEVVYHRSRPQANRLLLMLHTTWQVLTCDQHFDALYATSFRGLELIVLLRALGLFRRPLILWHHQAITPAASRWRERLARFFYRGMDKLFFFSDKLLADSLHSPKARPERMQVVHWGADLDFYDRLMREEGPSARRGFISTGKEHRDMPTLFAAFSRCGEELDVYVGRRTGGENYADEIAESPSAPHIRVHFTEGLIPRELAQRVWQAACITICCKPAPYTVGLTTLVEALALGLPVICTYNPHFAFDIEREGVGLTTPYFDIEAWQEAVTRIATCPEEAREMGLRARRLAESTFNLEQCAREVATALMTFAPKSHS